MQPASHDLDTASVPTQAPILPAPLAEQSTGIPTIPDINLSASDDFYNFPSTDTSDLTHLGIIYTQPAAVNNDQLCPLYTAVANTGVPNFMRARLPLPQTLHSPAWRRYLKNYTSDPFLCDFLQFGGPWTILLR